jgi:peptidoglycan lytic transglycosylase
LSLRFRLRGMRPLHVLIVTTTVIAAGSAAALAGVTAAAGQTVPTPLTLNLNPGRAAFGHPVAVSGRAPSTDAGKAVALESASQTGAPWHQVATGQIGRRGGFHFRIVARRSAVLRAVEAPVATADLASAAAAAPTGAATPASPQTPLKVAARLAVHPHQYAVLGSGGIRVAGLLMPAAAGRMVRLESHTGQGWHTVAHGQTGRRGRFSLRYAPGAGTGRRLRVRFGGDATNAGTTRPAGSVSVFYQDVASWYTDAGNTACGFHAGLGVANRTLPCGTHVAFHYGGRTVTAVVDDRGPYVGGRNWDLNQNTVAALGFAGAGEVWVSG